MAKWREHLGGDGHQHQQQVAADEDVVLSCDGAVNSGESARCYDLPYGMSFVRRRTLLKFVPFCPTFLIDVNSRPTRDSEVAAAAASANDVEANVDGLVADEDSSLNVRLRA